MIAAAKTVSAAEFFCELPPVKRFLDPFRPKLARRKSFFPAEYSVIAVTKTISATQSFVIAAPETISAAEFLVNCPESNVSSTAFSVFSTGDLLPRLRCLHSHV